MDEMLNFRGRMTSWLALFALTLQLALSFGHVHAPHVALDSAKVYAASQTSPAAPADDDAAFGACAICSVIHLAGTLDLPTAAALPVLTSHAVAWSIPAAGLAASGGTDGFRARAPPQA